MLLQLGTDGFGTASIRLNSRNIFGRWRNWTTQNAIKHEDTTRHGRSIRTIGSHLENRSLGQNTTAMPLGFERDFAKFQPIDTRNAVVLSETGVEHGEVALDEV